LSKQGKNFTEYGVLMKKRALALVLVSAALLVSSMALTGCAAAPEDEVVTSPFEGSWACTGNITGLATDNITFSADNWTQVTTFLTFVATGKGTFTYNETAKTLTLTATQMASTDGVFHTLTTPETDIFTYIISGSTLTLTDSDNEASTYKKQ
jgi:hypothetical protein